ncbi:hypothetical protein BDA96_02G266000 [Sorghum bicolor]|uniref:Uncharacterized protein n=1 Tax=Sorghum bicolor TaxID=4558 RepID=A0A921UTU8_SORBI|nr:hypothetical protein BDA96_02G266000 [Sorghum bicolor]
MLIHIAGNGNASSTIDRMPVRPHFVWFIRPTPLRGAARAGDFLVSSSLGSRIFFLCS